MTSVRVLIEPERLDPEGLREMLDADGCGSVVSFVGLTRGEDDGVTVERLEFDAWEGKLPGVLNELAEQALGQFGVSSVVLPIAPARSSRVSPSCASMLAQPIGPRVARPAAG